MQTNKREHYSQGPSLQNTRSPNGHLTRRGITHSQVIKEIVRCNLTKMVKSLHQDLKTTVLLFVG